MKAMTFVCFAVLLAQAQTPQPPITFKSEDDDTSQVA